MKPRFPLLRNRSKQGFTLIEAIVSILLLVSITGMIAFGSASFEKTFVVYDVYSALSDEVSRQAELVRGTPTATLLAETPNAGQVYTLPIGTATVNPLNGFLPVQGAALVPTVTWQRNQVAYGQNIGNTKQINYIITIVATVTIDNQILKDQTTVMRLFDASQQ